jgi:hypothetical protein
MMAAIFDVYMLAIWLIFAKLKLLRLSLPIALGLAAVGPGFALFILLSMNNYHPSPLTRGCSNALSRSFRISRRRAGLKAWRSSRTPRSKRATLFSRSTHNHFSLKSSACRRR